MQTEITTLQGHTSTQPTDHQEYADDTIIYMEPKTTEIALQYLKHYKIVTRSRQIPIQWGKTEMLTNRTKTQKKIHLPEPYDKIKHVQKGKVLGKIISIKNNTGEAIKQRLQKAKTNMEQNKKTIFTNKNLYVKTRILLWNALIRSILTYALQTQENTQTMNTKMEQFAFNCLRQIDNENWHLQEKTI